MKQPPVRNRSQLAEQIAESIRRKIEEQRLSAGDRLPSEAELLNEHQVSRSVLREAINRLQQIGLVDVQQGKGMFVGHRDGLASYVQFARSAMAITPRNLAQFGELRSALECWAARRAAEVATPEQVNELEQMVARLDDVNQSYEDAIQIDFSFHRRIFEIAGNPLITSILETLQEFVLEGMVQTTPEPRDHDVSQQLHRSVVSAIRCGDPDLAEAAMRAHMTVTIRRLAALGQEITN